MKKKIKITEVAPRDGFQILPKYIPLGKKADLIYRLIDAGCKEIEASAFVSPKWVPQMADSAELVKLFENEQRSILTYLVPNFKGAQRAIDAGVKQLFVTTSASIKHARDNLNQTIDEVLEGAEAIAELAKKNNVVYTASIACAFGYELDPEPVPVERVCQMVKRLSAAGYNAVTLCDTSGHANPESVKELCNAVLASTSVELGIHLHQAEGIEFANALAALECGVELFESAAGGMGGCPFVKKAKGNIATETLIKMFGAMGYETDIEPEKMAECAKIAQDIKANYGSVDCCCK